MHKVCVACGKSYTPNPKTTACGLCQECVKTHVCAEYANARGACRICGNSVTVIGVPSPFDEEDMAEGAQAVSELMLDSDSESGDSEGTLRQEVY